MEILALLLSIAGAGIAIASAIFTRQQVVVAKASSRAQALLSVMDYLQRADIREARRTVLTTLEGLPLGQWTAAHRATASTAAASYDLVGTLLRDDLVDPRPILQNWGASIIRCHRICRPMVNELRQSMSPELAKTYWDDFDWLVVEAARTLGHALDDAEGAV